MLLTRFWWNFKGRFWEHLEKIPKVRVILSLQHLSISGISQLLLTRSWPNFKGRFLRPSLTNANCHSDIYPGNILTYWPYFVQTFWTQFFRGLKRSEIGYSSPCSHFCFFFFSHLCGLGLLFLFSHIIFTGSASSPSLDSSPCERSGTTVSSSLPLSFHLGISPALL